MNTANDEYFTIKEVADKLKVAYLTVYRWIREGKLKAKKAGKQYRVKMSDVEDFISMK